jgi:hypothetical protein
VPSASVVAICDAIRAAAVRKASSPRMRCTAAWIAAEVGRPVRRSMPAPDHATRAAVSMPAARPSATTTGMPCRSACWVCR